MAVDLPDLMDAKGQESAKRAREIAAAGDYNLLTNGPLGAGKSMPAARLPPLSPRELQEVSMIHLLAGEIAGDQLTDRRRNAGAAGRDFARSSRRAVSV
jgi:magnesium chelatase family protein